MPGYQTIEANGDDENGHATNQTASMRGKSRGRKDGGFAGQASWISSVINLVNTIVGAGVLAMPLAMSHMGVLLGSFVIAWAGVTAGFGLYLQTRCARYLDRGTSSFFALSQITYPNAAVIFDAAIAIKCFGVGISYLIIIGDLMPGVVLGFHQNVRTAFLIDRHFWVTAFMLVIIPLSFLRRLDSLKYTSFIALTSIGYLVLLVLAHFIRGDTIEERGPVRYVRWGGVIPTLSSFPVIIFAYTCHQNMFSILNEIKDNSPKSTVGVVLTSIISTSSTYLLVAITGYLSFGNNITGNIMEMYYPSIASTIGKAAIVVLVMFSFPLQVHPCRASIDAVLKWRPSSSTLKTPRPHSPGSSSPSRLSAAPLLPSKTSPQARIDAMGDTRFAIITSVLIFSSYLVAMSVSSLEKVLAYVGSTGSTSISFILPGLFYYKISDPDSDLHQRMLKEDDDNDEEGRGRHGAGESAQFGRGDEEDEEGGGSGVGGFVKGLRRRWRGKVLRRLSLGLAVYGVIVMIVCLVTNTLFVVAH